MDLVRVYIAVVLPLVVYCVCESGLQACEWESWSVWSSCTRTCAGVRTRTRKMCCGAHVPDCIGKCHRPNTSVETEPCATQCPNGGSFIDGYCHCPPLKYGICCERDETAASGDCARHCTWFNWFSWGDCSTDCGCGTRTRKRWRCCRRGLSSSKCTQDCNFRDNSTEKRVCTKRCTSYDGRPSCTLCSWNTWQQWTSCSKDCGGGYRSRSRSPCCCEGQNVEDCLSDCGLAEEDTVQSDSCNDVCYNGGSFSFSTCNCTQGYSGQCCSKEVTDGNCSKCSWGDWGGWNTCDTSTRRVSRNRKPCCRIGQNSRECFDECKLETTEATQWQSCPFLKDPAQVHIMYAVIASVAAVVVTSLVWTACYCAHRRRNKDGSRPLNDAMDMTTSCSGARNLYTNNSAVRQCFLNSGERVGGTAGKIPRRNESSNGAWAKDIADDSSADGDLYDSVENIYVNS
ncbi:A disintegrin and metalloproteinase with thrombospondin motifs adt-2-like [Haliotis asinina]|uniref:A disintegrin and metalloproteinase with thrombospondin motifs adt-2-like n=1 Tax=Haliotis asinina TaxID=109174 RepID=UPI003531AF2E